jgi:hypothetical protein
VARDSGYAIGTLRGRSLVVVGALVVVVTVPLAIGTWSVAMDQLLESRATPLAHTWAAQNDWLLTTLSASDGDVVVTALGSPPDADPADLRKAMNDNGLGDAGLIVRLVLGGSVTCPSGGESCSRDSG